MTVARTKGSCEIYLHYVSAPLCTVELQTNIKGRKPFAPETDVIKDIKVSVSHEEVSGDIFFIFSVYHGSNLSERYKFGPLEEREDITARIFFNNQFISFYIDDLWAYSYGYQDPTYPEGAISVSVSSSGADTTLIDVRRVELSDYREAIFVDYEQTAENAISSIIQGRPIEIYSETSRQLAFTYASIRDEVNALYVERIQENIEDPSSMSSDGLVYFSDVGVTLDPIVAKEVGFITRLYRMSEIDSGAMEAAAIVQNRSREQRKRYSINSRLDVRLEIGDIYNIDVVVTSTNRHITKSIVVEDLSISLDDRRQGMSVSGRIIE